MSDALLLRAETYLEKGDYNQAIADFTETIRLKPADVSEEYLAPTYNNRGYAYYSMRNYDQSIADLTATIRIDPNLAVAFSVRGHAYFDKGDYDRTISDLTEAVRLGKNDAAVYNTRGCAYVHKKDYDRAVADFEMAVKLSPRNNQYRQNLEGSKKAKTRHTGFFNIIAYIFCFFCGVILGGILFWYISEELFKTAGIVTLIVCVGGAIIGGAIGIIGWKNDWWHS